MFDQLSQLSHVFTPERAHTLAISALKLGVHARDYAQPDPVLQTEIAGLSLPNCLGLAAGFDKNADVYNPMLGFGFGFVECGTVTPKPQPGNAKPRLFRLGEDQAVINRMGFNNAGHQAFADNLAKPHKGIVGANIGANKNSDDRLLDYRLGLRHLWGLAAYFTVNISSPNTPGLRALQSGDHLQALLGGIQEEHAALRAKDPQHNPPLFLKVAPDLSDEDIPEIMAAAKSFGMDGLIVSNTTIARPETLKSQHRDETGGLSGRPVFAPSTRVLAAFYACDPQMPLIGVGGVEDGATALAKIKSGASAIQLYSALVYHGPGLAKRILGDLKARLQAEGFATVTEAVGVDVRS